MVKSKTLAEYETRRDFSKTAEPRGDAGVRPSERPRFVVQRHDATRLHYDLRLEVDGVFKSWAVTKGPSLNPSDKRLAVQTEDHPLGYGDFEGTIPKGQYGGGTVQLFDRGYWRSENGEPGTALDGGELKFALDGKHLIGSFVLVRMKGDKFGGKRINWLLIKHRDGAANEADDGGGIQRIDKSVASGRAMATIAAGKGRAPTAFMLGKDMAPAPDAIWNSNHGLASEARRSGHETAAQEEPAPATTKLDPRADVRKAKAPAKKASTRESVAKKTDSKKATKRGPASKGPSRRSAEPDPMPDFVPPQLCRSVSTPPSGEHWLHEIKFDGYRVQLRVENGAARLLTRSGLDWTAKFAGLAEAASMLPTMIIDGEVVALDAAGKPDFSALQAAIAGGKTDKLVFFAFDLLYADGEDLRGEALANRKARLADDLADHACGSIRFVEHFTKDGAAVFASARELDLEGVVSKRADSPYRSGRSETWTKAKCRPAHEVVVGAWTEKGGKFRSLLGGVFRGDKLVYVGRIGTGFGRGVVDRLMPELEKRARKTNPFDPKASPPRDREIRWLEPTLVAEIEFAGWTGDGTVRQASFKGLRADKDASEVVAAEPAKPDAAPTGPIQAFTVAKSSRTAEAKGGVPGPATSKRTAGGRVVVAGVSLSHPDKALWPAIDGGEPVTKQDLARYFEAVALWMMPHIVGRPCSIIRAPDGIEAETFFQRHAMAGGSKLIDNISISGDRKPYLVIRRPDALVAVAQSGGIELHPSNCAPDYPNVPGRLIFDLDPAPDVPFADVVRAAKELKAVLDAIGLVAFPKTTGGKGLHLVTPLTTDKKPVDWEAAKLFARDCCVVLERAHPDRFLTKQSKAARQGKIYLDYLRNDRLSTAVAPLSPRGRPGAPVSMPLSWSQVKATLDPLRYTLRSVPCLIANSKAWADYEEGVRPIRDAMAKLKRI